MRGCLGVVAALVLVGLVLQYWYVLVGLILLAVLAQMAVIGVRAVHARRVVRQQAIKDEAWLTARRTLNMARMSPDDILRHEVDQIIAYRGEGEFIKEMDARLAQERMRQGWVPDFTRGEPLPDTPSRTPAQQPDGWVDYDPIEPQPRKPSPPPRGKGNPKRVYIYGDDYNRKARRK